MGYSAARTVSPLANDCLFILAAVAAAMVYTLSSSFLSTGSSIKHVSGYRDGKGGLTENISSSGYISRQDVANTRDNVTLVALPAQPDRMVLLLLSIVASNSEISQAVSDAIISCLSNVSETEMKNWGVFGLDRFTPTLVQVEYFVLSSEKGSLTVPGKVDGFIRDRKLTTCVRALNAGLPDNGSLLEGRTVIAAESGSIVSSSGQAPGWTIGVVIGCVAGIGVIALVVLWCKGERVYKEEDYEKYEDNECFDDEDMSEGEDEDGEMRNVNVD